MAKNGSESRRKGELKAETPARTKAWRQSEGRVCRQKQEVSSVKRDGPGSKGKRLPKSRLWSQQGEKELYKLQGYSVN